MENIFLSLFNLSINAGWLVLAVILLRSLMKKAPKWLHCLLWSIVGIRLILPFSLESIFGIFPTKEFISPDALYEMSPTVDSGFEGVNQVINPVFSEMFASAPENSVNPLQIVTILASYIWIAGMIAMLVYTLFSYINLKRKVATATKLTDNIYQCENVSSPFILGLIRPKIYIRYNTSENDRKYIIAHEKAHLKRKDHLIKPFAFLILAVYWFNPLMWISYILLCRDIELACDEKVVRDYDKDMCKEYSYALLSCSVNRKSIAACPLAFGEVGVKDRIKNVLSYKKPAFWVIVISIIFCLITAICFLTTRRTVTLPEGYLYEPMSVKTDKIEITTPNNIYFFTSEERIKYLHELINDIRVDKSKTVKATTFDDDSFPYPSYVIKAYEGDNQTFELCISDDFKHIWKSEDRECEYLFTSGKDKDLKSLMTTKVVNAHLREQTDILIPELLADLYGYSSVSDGMYCAESHYVFKEQFNTSLSADEYETESINIFVIYNCSLFSVNSSEVTLEGAAAQGVSEFIFKVFGDRVVFDSVTEHARGEGIQLADFGNTKEIDERLKKEVYEKAVIYAKTTKESEESLPERKEAEFTYDIVPVKLILGKEMFSSDFEDLIKEKSLNSSHMIRNENKQIYGSEYCLIYKEQSADEFFEELISYVNPEEKSNGLTSLSEVAEKYAAIEDEKDLFVVYIPDDSGMNSYEVTDFSFFDNNMTARITSKQSPADKDKNYSGYLAVIYAPKYVGILYEDFTAVVSAKESVWQGGNTVDLSDIENMNIGAQMPDIIYCDNGRLIMSGTFGLIIYDLNAKKVTDRLDYNLLKKLGIEYLLAYASSDGERIYIGNNDYPHAASSRALYTYYVNNKTLYYYDEELKNDTLYGGLRKLEGGDDNFSPEKGYIYSQMKKQDDYGKTYLRARDNRQMKTLQIVTQTNDGTREICDVFTNKMSFTIS